MLLTLLTDTICIFSIRDGTFLDVYVNCEWSRTEVLLAHSLDVPADCDIIVGYLFTVSLK